MRRLNYILETLAYILAVITTTSFAFNVPNRPRKATISTIIDTIPSRIIRAEKTNDLEPVIPQTTTSCLFSKSSDYENNEIQSSKRISDDVLGILVLLTVPLAWGTYVPVVRFLYAIDPPVPGFVFSACYYALAAITTSSLVFWQTTKTVESSSEREKQENNNQTTKLNLPIAGGIELGSYLFIANCLQVIGLETVQSDRAGFLVQFTTVMVPFAEALFAGNLLTVPIRTWFACVFAFLGLFIMGLDGKAELANDPISALVLAFSSFSKGDFLILGAAVLYTMHVVRLSSYARETTPMKLAASKSTWETILSILLVVGLTSIAPLADERQGGLLGFAAETGKEITTFFSSFSDGFTSGNIPSSALVPALGAVLWTGWVTCAYTIYAQSFGQSRVSPTNANLIYTFQPIFTALFAWVLLGETMGPAGILGGSIIAASVYIVASANLVAESKPLSLATNDKNLDPETYQLKSDINNNEKESVEKKKEVLVDLIDS